MGYWAKGDALEKKGPKKRVQKGWGRRYPPSFNDERGSFGTGGACLQNKSGKDLTTKPGKRGGKIGGNKKSVGPRFYVKG